MFIVRLFLWLLYLLSNLLSLLTIQLLLKHLSLSFKEIYFLLLLVLRVLALLEFNELLLKVTRTHKTWLWLFDALIWFQIIISSSLLSTTASIIFIFLYILVIPLSSVISDELIEHLITISELNTFTLIITLIHQRSGFDILIGPHLFCIFKITVLSLVLLVLFFINTLLSLILLWFSEIFNLVVPDELIDIKRLSKLWSCTLRLFSLLSNEMTPFIPTVILIKWWHMWKMNINWFILI